MTPTRLIGALAIRPLADTKAYSVHGRVRLGLKKSIERMGATTFRYGGLRVRLHEHNYTDVITEPSETFYTDPPEKFRSTEIVLRDAQSVKSGGKEQQTYTVGTEQFFTVEVSPADSPPAAQVRRRKLPDGLRALEVATEGQWLMVIHNPSPKAVSAAVPVPNTKEVRCHQANGATSTSSVIGVHENQARCLIPTASHVVLSAGGYSAIPTP
ncbi:MAG: hypothetical protein HZA90_13670 [Verrucomicrobia bacterium]|nr:hypothetical protein [Verrucomicrobiota bacterium]